MGFRPTRLRLFTPEPPGDALALLGLGLGLLPEAPFAGGGIRTLKLSRAPAPKTGVSANSTTPAASAGEV